MISCKYIHLDDRRDKEGDLAREGYIYHFHLSSVEECLLRDFDTWLVETSLKDRDYKVTRSSYSVHDQYVFARHVIMRDEVDAVLMRLRWC